jgi:hypothetical protein
VNVAYLKRTFITSRPRVFTADSIVNPWINVIAGIFVEEYGFNGRQINMIVEAVEYHNKAMLGSCNEMRLLRNADGVDYLDCVAVARDKIKFPNNFVKALEVFKSTKEQFYPMIDLPFALKLRCAAHCRDGAFYQAVRRGNYGMI